MGPLIVGVAGLAALWVTVLVLVGVKRRDRKNMLALAANWATVVGLYFLLFVATDWGHSQLTAKEMVPRPSSQVLAQ
jgi:hypothetical protein